MSCPFSQCTVIVKCQYYHHYLDLTKMTAILGWSDYQNEIKKTHNKIWVVKASFGLNYEVVQLY